MTYLSKLSNCLKLSRNYLIDSNKLSSAKYSIFAQIRQFRHPNGGRKQGAGHLPILAGHALETEKVLLINRNIISTYWEHQNGRS